MSDAIMTPDELRYHLRECQAPEGCCIVCDISRAASGITHKEEYLKGWNDAITAAMEWYKTKQAVPLHTFLEKARESLGKI